MQENVWFNNKIKQKQTNRALCTVNITNTQCKTMDQHRTADTRRLNRETNKGDTGGATETMIS